MVLRLKFSVQLEQNQQGVKWIRKEGLSVVCGLGLHVVFSGRTQLCVTGVSMDLQALKVGKNSPSSVLHANDADLRTH
ncbi:hypothetical protein J6590_089068 [Homalodisca vitripennis]|nr:hypothetical protein J6590_089068 [Homalodisca vitripennis]